MSRPLRIQYEGVLYHVMSRGDRRQAIFAEAEDRRTFLDRLERACAKTGWQVHAYVLMGNHFHLVIETPQPNLSAGMKWLLGVYTQAFNRRHGHWGHLFGGRYKAQPLDGRDPLYLRVACDYVHLNPARAGLVAAEEALESFAWSSYPAYLRPARRPEWLRCDRLLGEHGLTEGAARSAREFGRRMERTRREAAGAKDEGESRATAALASVRGWRVGAEDFAEWLSERLRRRGKKSERGQERAETDEYLAERIVRAGLLAEGWSAAELSKCRKGDAGKLRIARQVREQTPMTLAWIAQRLQMGSASYVAALLTTEIKSVKKWN